MKIDEKLNSYYLQFGPNYRIIKKQSSLPQISGITVPTVGRRRNNKVGSPMNIIGDSKQTNYTT